MLHKVIMKFNFVKILGAVLCIFKHSITADSDIVVIFVYHTCVQDFNTVMVDKIWVNRSTRALNVQMMILNMMRHRRALGCSTTKVTQTHCGHRHIVIDMVIS